MSEEKKADKHHPTPLPAKPKFEVAENTIAVQLKDLGAKMIDGSGSGDIDPATTIAGAVDKTLATLANEPPAIPNDLQEAIDKPANRPLLRPSQLTLATALATAKSKSEQDQAAAQFALHTAQGAWTHALTLYTTQRKAALDTFQRAYDQAWDEYLEKLADRVAPSVEIHAHYTMGVAIGTAADTFFTAEAGLITNLGTAFGTLATAYATCANAAVKAATTSNDTQMAAQLTYWAAVVKVLTS
ncbi:MAG: hypothetical protein ACE37K_03730 [Planctomycetota bacterium]